MKNIGSAFSLVALSCFLTASSTLSACAQLEPKKDYSKKSQHLAAAPALEPAAPVPSEPIGVQKGDILLVYPRAEKNNKIDCASTFIVGAVKAGKALNCNGEAVAVNADGYFAHVVKLKFGTNSFALGSPGEVQTFNVEILRPTPPPLLSVGSFNILPESLEPKENIGISNGDLIQFGARATPGCQLHVELGGRKIPLKPLLSKGGKAPAVNLGLDTAFGVSYQRSPAAVKDLYLGIYKIQSTDNWDSVTPVFVLQNGKRQIRAKGKGQICVLRQPRMLKTAHANCIVRVAPGAARNTPLPQDIRMMADGFKGDCWRLELCPGKHVWINKEDMVADESAALIQSRVSTINLSSDDYGACITIPLAQRLPYQLDHDLNGKKLTLHIFGATADTDFVTADTQRPTDSECAKLMNYLSFKQKDDQHYELTVQLAHKQQWGYWAEYRDTNLLLHLKKAPAIDLASGNLSGAIICVDPGHGGKEIGSIGCSGVKEASVNFAIADRLRKELEALGARVVMTRSGDTFIGLQERVDMAVAAGADLLISVHNNALPDGRDPLADHGTSSYWYHAQAIELARLAQKQLVQATGLKDFGSRYQNLALCRPTQMPAFLMEIAFMINPDELSKLLDARFQQTVAKSIAGSVKKFLVEKVKEQSSETQPTP